MLSNNSFEKESIDYYLKELSKEYRKSNGKIPIEIILVGGASVLINYNFRELTLDMDAYISSAYAIKDAVSKVSDKYKLPIDWINTDFTKTSSFSQKIVQYSQPYKTFSNVISVRTVTAEYLVAMKLMAGRKYKNDLSDIVGILNEHKKADNPISFERIDKAVCHLYNGWEGIPDSSQKFIRMIYDQNNLEVAYNQIKSSESQSKDILIEFEKSYPGVLKEGNTDAVLENKSKSRQDTDKSLLIFPPTGRSR